MLVTPTCLFMHMPHAYDSSCNVVPLTCPSVPYNAQSFSFLGLLSGFSLILESDKYHAWVNAEFMLEKCLVGTLDGQ